MARAKFFFSILTIVIFASSCGGETADHDPASTLTRGINGDPEVLDPHLYSSTQAGQILRDIGEGLVQYGADGELIGGVASSWHVSKSGLTYTFRLRDDARWSNGQNVIADDFVKAFRTLADPETASPSAKNLSPVSNFDLISNDQESTDTLGVYANGEKTLIIQLSVPTPYFIHILAHPSTFPLCSSCSSDKDRHPNFATVSNGAYKLERWLPSSEIILVRNKYYWNDPETSFDTVKYYVADPSVEVDRFRAGEIDVTSNIDPSKFKIMLEKNPDLVKVSPYLGVYYLGFNLEKEPFRSDLKLRAALSLAIDREAIVQSVTQRGEIPAYNFVPTNVSHYSPPKGIPLKVSREEQIRRAQQLFIESEYAARDSPPIQLRINTLGGHRNIALAVRSMWKEVLGVETEIVSEEFRVLLSNIQARQVTQVFRLSWTGDYNDAHTFLQLFVSDNPNNLTGYSNPDVDKLMRKSDLVAAEQRMQLMQEAEKISLQDHPVIPLYFFVTKHLVHAGILGWQENVLDLHPSKRLSRRQNRRPD